MTDHSVLDIRHRVIRCWLIAIAGLIFAIILVGGATRLTESGLSIVEWKPVSGVLPPLSAQGWQAEFEKYQTIPQYQAIHRGMSLDEFKTIFWWEWTHRQLGRFIGVMFLLPLIWFVWRGWVGPGLRGRLSAIFALGAFQGGVGWWMVASGLSERIEVSQYRLATHLVLASLIFAACLWTAQRMLPAPHAPASSRLRWGAAGCAVLVFIQLYLGALVAGLRAGLVYNTWPLIDGTLVPDASQLFLLTPAWRNLFENALTVQFDHRLTAYTVWVVAILHALDVWRSGQGRGAFTSAAALACGVTLQAILGILTLVHQAPIDLALIHQGMAMVVLGMAVIHAERLIGRRRQQHDEMVGTALRPRTL